MSSPTPNPSSDPLLDRNHFRERTFYPQQIRPFTEALALLPVPILPEHDDWLEMYWRAWEIGWQQLRRPSALAGFISSYSGPVADENLSMWETAFSLQYGLYGRRAFHFAGSLDNFYAKQHDDGYICREINEQDGHDFFEKFAPGSTGPNLLPWTEWRYYRQTGDETRLHEVFWPMLAYHRWLRRHRTWRNGGYWGTGRSAGSGGHIPNAGADYHGHHIWLEPTLHACLNCFYLTQIGESVGAGDILAELHREREQLLRLITDQLWDRDDQFLHDLGPDGQFAPAKSIGAYWALFDPSLLPGKLQEGFLAHLKDETAFARQHPLPEAVPAEDLRDRGREARPHQVAALGEEPAGAGAPLQAVALVGDRQGHVAGLGRHPQLFEQPAERGVVAAVVDDEAGVDVEVAVVEVHADRVRVAADAPVGLVEHQVVASVQVVGGRQPGDARPDDRDAHPSSSRLGGRVEFGAVGLSG